MPPPPPLSHPDTTALKKIEMEYAGGWKEGITDGEKISNTVNSYSRFQPEASTIYLDCAKFLEISPILSLWVGSKKVHYSCFIGPSQ